ncbi:Glyoxylase, beta-lactamase superfamily II [Catalinimonas alkaloidigena]|uniref:Glyoxylase, beta-lactamase superfamily II n=1 Tax=Catalinimonas alkaloidigena TaxID=1075417 RepID=A0A1G9P6T7_9BACT|nr:MBL fold metallo-hydrolase [Catalinimonas alkaloidigena]SDL94450.1 Glyoxylase, beta-lactamase superfamily II [Catalinimonas alkaloidigena]
MDLTEQITNPGYVKMQLGKLEVFVLTDGFSDVSPIQPFFAPKASPEAVSTLLANHFLTTDKITLAGNVMLIKSPDRTVLIDTGSGHRISPTAGKLFHHLVSTGLTPDHITDVVFTHAHPDHIGGIVDEEGNLVFSKAEFHIASAEYTFWNSEEPDFSNGTKNAIADFEIQFAREHLKLIRSHIRFYDFQDTLFGFLELHAAPGHTPGHTIIRIFSEEEELLHIADAFQHILLVEHPEWGNQIDSDFSLAVETRLSILEKLAASRQLFFGDHLPYPGLGYIKKENARYYYVPKDFYTI